MTINTEKLVSKRVFVTLPDLAYDKLERWADSQGRPVANLAAFLLETALNEAEEEGKIPLQKNSPPASGTAESKGRGKKAGDKE